MGFPAAIELAIWLNQVRNGSISTTDAVNAAETITQSLVIEPDADLGSTSASDWPALVELAKSFKVPCFALLPSPGHPYGLSAHVISRVDPNFGVCILGDEYLLAKTNSQDPTWFLSDLTNTIPALDPKSARLVLQDLIDKSTVELTSMELTGNRELVEQELHQLRPIHLPPALSNRVRNDLELAERIWLIAQISMNEAQAPHSRSLDEQKLNRLRELRHAAINLMTASTLAA